MHFILAFILVFLFFLFKSIYKRVKRSYHKPDGFPYVYIDNMGWARELSIQEKKYLQEEFSPADGDRPYIKSSYKSLTPDKKIGGFLKREKLPIKINIRKAPPEELELLEIIFEKLWIASSKGDDYIKHIWYPIQEISKATDTKREKIKEIIFNLVKLEILELKSKDPLLFSFTSKGKQINSKQDFHNLIKTLHNT